MLIAGAHMSIAKGFLEAAKQTKENYKANALQIFLRSPRSRTEKPLDLDEAAQVKKYIKQNKIFLIGHCSYLLNFAKDIDKDPWPVQSLISDIKKIYQLGGIGVVSHMGKTLNLKKTQAYKYLQKNLKKVLKKTEKEGIWIILENTAGQGSEMGCTFEDLKYLYDLLGKNKRIRFCFDTAHSFVSGYDLSTKKTVKETFNKFNKTIGLNKIALIHFNDSKKELGSKVDRHANLGDGLINKEGLKEIIKIAKRESIPLILETPEKGKKTHLDDLQTLRKWAQ